jgi:hypothetical protein
MELLMVVLLEQMQAFSSEDAAALAPISVTLGTKLKIPKSASLSLLSPSFNGFLQYYDLFLF